MKKPTELPFLKPLFAASKRQVVLWGVLIVMLLLKLYEGDKAFFVKHFSHLDVDEQTFLWLKWVWHHAGSLLFMFLIPVIFIKTMLKEKLLDYGLGMGDYKFGLKATLAAFIIMPFVVYQTAQNPEHAEFYRSQFPLVLANSSALMFGLWALTYLPHYIGWEFLFRGFVGLGFKKEMGVFAAMMLQVLLTTLMHIGKPQGETWGTVFGGIYLGLLTVRTGSIWYATAFHLYIGLLNSWFCG